MENVGSAPLWQEDSLLGPRYATLPVGDATLIRYDGAEPEVWARPRGVVLHVHGYNDYFFQDHLARMFADAGYLFYAVDLYAAGRSWQPDQLPHYVTDLRQQADGLALAAQHIRATHPDVPLIVHAHSTGGLTAALWAHAFRNETGEQAGPDALILNSPFLALPGGWLARDVAGPATLPIGKLRPTAVLSHNPSEFTSLMAGRWEFDHNLKRPDGLPLRLGWLRAVQQGQHRVRAGLQIRAPIMLATSAGSSSSHARAGANPLATSTDTVLDVAAIWAQAPHLGYVNLVKIVGGVHDLSLSDDGPREEYFSTMLDWLD